MPGNIYPNHFTNITCNKIKYLSKSPSLLFLPQITLITTKNVRFNTHLYATLINYSPVPYFNCFPCNLKL